MGDILDRRLGLPARRAGALRRRPQAQRASCLEELSRHVRFVPVCPEVGIGLGVPREPIRLVRRGGAGAPGGRRRARTTPDAMRAWAVATAADLREPRPVRLRAEEGLAELRPRAREGAGDERSERPSPEGRGMFARVLAEQLPGLALEEEGRAERRRACASTSWTACSATPACATSSRPTGAPDDLVRFHVGREGGRAGPRPRDRP